MQGGGCGHEQRVVEKESGGLSDFGRSKLLCDFSRGGDMGFLYILLTPLLLIFYV